MGILGWIFFILLIVGGAAYLVAEGFFVLQAIAAQRDGDRDRQRYRTIASDVARKALSANRPVGNWDYYEFMV